VGSLPGARKQPSAGASIASRISASGKLSRLPLPHARDGKHRVRGVIVQPAGESTPGVSAVGGMPPIVVAHGQQMRGYRSSALVYATFSFAMGALHGQIGVMHLVRAPSCKRHGLGGRHDGKSARGALWGDRIKVGGATGPAGAGLVGFGGVHITPG